MRVFWLLFFCSAISFVVGAWLGTIKNEQSLALENSLSANPVPIHSVALRKEKHQEMTKPISDEEQPQPSKTQCLEYAEKISALEEKNQILVSELKALQE